jgi:hypothetical protein
MIFSQNCLDFVKFSHFDESVLSLKIFTKTVDAQFLRVHETNSTSRLIKNLKPIDKTKHGWYSG